MVVTITRLEATDINFDDKVQAFVLSELLVNMLVGSTKIKEADTSDPESVRLAMKGLVADFLNHASEKGIIITGPQS